MISHSVTGRVSSSPEKRIDLGPVARDLDTLLRDIQIPAERGKEQRIKIIKNVINKILVIKRDDHNKKICKIMGSLQQVNGKVSSLERQLEKANRKE
jgi:hypothetical protein